MSSYLSSAFKSLGLSSGNDAEAASASRPGHPTSQPMHVWIAPDTDHNHFVPATVNDPAQPMEIENDHFVGRVLVRIKDYGPKNARTPEGRFKEDTPAADLYFGGAFDSKAVQPSGFWLIWKVATLIDPSLVYAWSDKPYFFSPVASAMNVIRAERAQHPWPARKAAESDKHTDRKSVESEHTVVNRNSHASTGTVGTLHSVPQQSKQAPKHRRKSSVGSSDGDKRSRRGSKISAADAKKELNEDGLVARPCRDLNSDVLGPWPLTPPHPDDELAEDTEVWWEDCGFEDGAPVSTTSGGERRRYFRTPRNLQNPDVVFLKDQVYCFEIFAPFIDLNTYDLSLGITLNMKRYCEGQDMRLIMCSAHKDPDTGAVNWTEGKVHCAIEFRLKEFGHT
ncbi:hypothetical protein DFJ74DRAFT_712454 [Hyaloraphidium curvatum]|nr:hypothetical protein DFJ74DRAFT_712454 [Hyaloraphidium curvatum]